MHNNGMKKVAFHFQPLGNTTYDVNVLLVT